MSHHSRIALTMVAAAACAHRTATSGFPHAAPTRPATDAPERFAPPAAGAGAADGACRSPVRDPRSGAELRFVRSTPGLGDYAVPQGAYGARAGELLRIDCRTWRAVGLVAR